MAPLGKLGRIVEVTVHLVLMLVVRILRAKHCRAYGAGKVLNVVFSIQSRDVRATQGATTRVTEELQSSEVVRFTQRILLGFVFSVDREKFRCDNLATILFTTSQSQKGQQACQCTYLAFEAFEMIRRI